MSSWGVFSFAIPFLINFQALDKNLAFYGSEEFLFFPILFLGNYVFPFSFEAFLEFSLEVPLIS